jgi:hypothetical protein
MVHAQDLERRLEPAQRPPHLDVLALVQAKARATRGDIPHRHGRHDGTTASHEQAAALDRRIPAGVRHDGASHTDRQRTRPLPDHRSSG